MVEATPPIPLDTTTPSRSGSTSGDPASAHASRAATMASCSQRSSRRACTRSSTVAGSTAAGRRDLHRQRHVGPVGGELARPAPTGQQRFPGRGYVPAQRRGRAQPGDDDAWLICPHCESLLLLTFGASGLAGACRRTGWRARGAAGAALAQADTSALWT